MSTFIVGRSDRLRDGLRALMRSISNLEILGEIDDQVGVAIESSRLRLQAEQAAVIEDRARLARDLHDSLTQQLYSLTLFAEASREYAAAGDMERLEPLLDKLGGTALEVLKEMRLHVYELRAPALDRAGLVGAIKQRLDAVEGRSGVEADLQVEGVIDLPSWVEDQLYRIIQEALNNSLAHASAKKVTVRISAVGETVGLEIADDGKGFDLHAIEDCGGMGLISMRDRAEKLGGSLAVLSTPGQGTKIKTSFELPDRSFKPHSISVRDRHFSKVAQ